MNTTVLDASVDFIPRPFLRPLPLRGGEVWEITEARVTARVRVNGREAVGRGAIFVSYPWAWPDDSIPSAERDQAMRSLCERIAADLPALTGGEPAHPLELGLRLHDAVCRRTDGLYGTMGVWECGSGTNRNPHTPTLPYTHTTRSGIRRTIPILARAVCMSPFDAAVHDAVGQALGRSAFELYAEDAVLPSAEPLFPGSTACRAIRSLLQPPNRTLDAWLIVGPQMPLAEMEPWIRERGYRCLKLRIPVEAGPDAERTVEVYRTAQAMGLARPRITVDSNEMHSSATAVLDYLERLEAEAPEVYAALEYLEQPTHRDIATHAFDWRPVARRKPVILDEGLTGPESLQPAVDQGWSGFALKTCKGHSFSLIAGAWAHARGLPLSMQDLTNPGLAAIHSALFAARMPAINGIELNSPQFTPAANEEWLPRLAGLFAPTGGVHRLPDDAPVGLGSRL